jgi:hypothetical protein
VVFSWSSREGVARFMPYTYILNMKNYVRTNIVNRSPLCARVFLASVSLPPLIVAPAACFGLVDLAISPTCSLTSLIGTPSF